MDIGQRKHEITKPFVRMNKRKENKPASSQPRLDEQYITYTLLLGV